MVFSFLSPAGQTYLLWHRFKMPTQSGPRDAVAVESQVADKLVSAYTFMLEHIVLLVWSIAVVTGLLICVQIYEETHPNSPFSTEIWQKRSSPYEILILALKNFKKSKSSRWFILIWLITALAFVVVKYTVPIIFAPYIKIGSAAPVNASAIFVPSRAGSTELSNLSNQENIKIYNFNVPAALRAVGSVDGVQGTLTGNSSVSVDQPEIIEELEDGEVVMQIGYRYSVTGLDLGLQYQPDLVFNVEGSCITDYSWWYGGDPLTNTICTGALVDNYYWFNNTSIPPQIVSKCDGVPLAFFNALPPSSESSGNWTWGAIISSINRTSFFPGTDPWYRTGPNPLYETDPNVLGESMVMPKRPALSCWENDVWSYQGNNGSTLDLSYLPGLDMSQGMIDILTAYLAQPMIFTLGTYLHASSLKSSTTSLLTVIDANISTIYNDLERLVFASYIATVNTLTETTLYAPSDGFPNLVQANGTILDGAGDFVIFSSDVAALSVRTLIIVPTLAVTLWIVFLAIMFMPLPKRALAPLAAAPEIETAQPNTDSKSEKRIGSGIQTVISNITGNDSEKSISGITP
jgi:hypothetical protein